MHLSKDPVLLNADRVTYDQKTKMATALGKVEISQGERLLRADKVVYDQQRNIVSAEGNVAILEENGHVSFADRAEVTSDLKQGFVNQLRILLADNSRFAAQEGERVDGRYIILRRATYSACDLCKEDPTKPPFWQLRAARVTHDNESKRIIYRDASLEFGGVPVLFSPYFSHPDPTVKRKTGFLTPVVGKNSNLGAYVTAPYYIDLAPDKDMTLAPTISDKDGFQFAGEYRERFAHGQMKFNGSAVVADRINDQDTLEKNQLRGHLFGDVRFDIGPSYRAGANIGFTSDKSYLYRYRIPTTDVLENRAYLERFGGRNYLDTDLYYFQDLRPGERQIEPVTLRAQYSALGAPGKTLGGRWEINASGVSLTRDDSIVSPVKRGPDSRRASLSGGWERRMISDFGLVSTFSGKVYSDLFWSNRVQDPDDPANHFRDSYAYRLFPLGSMMFSYPLARQGEHWQQVIEPIVSITASPRRSIDSHIANEDSQNVEFDETNLFAANRYSGLDRFETGVRATYGVRTAAYGDNGGRYEIMLGESYRLNRDDNFLPSSGLREKLSDYVGQIDVQPAPWFGANYGFQLNEETFQPRRSEANLFAGEPWLRPFVNYLSVDSDTAGQIGSTIAELTYGFSSNFTRYWTFTTYQRRALKTDPGPRTTGMALAYQDECATISLSGSKDQISRPDLNSGTSFMLSVYLRNLGGVQTDALSTLGNNNREVVHQ